MATPGGVFYKSAGGVFIKSPGGARGSLLLSVTSVYNSYTLGATGSVAGAEPLTIYGTNFQAGATVTIGGAAAPAVTVITTGPNAGKQLMCTSPGHHSGVVDVKVSNPDTTSGTLPGGFTYQTYTVNASIAGGNNPFLYLPATYTSGGNVVGVESGCYCRLYTQFTAPTLASGLEITGANLVISGYSLSGANFNYTAYQNTSLVVSGDTGATIWSKVGGGTNLAVISTATNPTTATITGLAVPAQGATVQMSLVSSLESGTPSGLNGIVSPTMDLVLTVDHS